MPVDGFGVTLAQLLREVGVHQLLQVRVVREPGGDQLVGDRDLRVREEHRELRLAQPLARVEEFADLPVARQELQGAVEVLVAGEAAHEALVGVEQGRGLDDGVGQGGVLRVVVAQHQVADLVGHLGEELVAP